MARRRIGVGRIVATAALAGGVVLAASALADQLRLHDLAGQARRGAGATSPAAQRAVAAALGDCPASGDERVLQLCAAGYAALAGRSTAVERTRALAAARGAVDRLLAAHPDLGETWALSAYLRTLAGSPAAAAADLAHSYRVAPYLRRQGFWRLWFGGRAWTLLDAHTQGLLLREALWLQSLGQSDRVAVHNALARTPPFLTVALRTPGRGGEGLPLPPLPD